MWPQDAQRQYRALLGQASEVEVISTGPYTRRAMQARNEWMNVHADVVLALWNGSAGGTGNCVRHAVATGRLVLNLWPQWLANCRDGQ